MWQIRQQLLDNDMPIDDEPDEEENEPRQSYNVAPGYNEVVYRAYHPTADSSGETEEQAVDEAVDVSADDNNTAENVEEQAEDETTEQPKAIPEHSKILLDTSKTQYKLQTMKWGLIPFWTKRNPDYGTLMRTINCRDDSLIEDKGMWTSMKKKKRCIVIAQGFFEWLKLDGGKKKVPHFIRRKDGKLLCMAGLWDRCTYEDTTDPIYSYSIITTANNKAMDFLHDRMPVILENGSPEIQKWLDPSTVTWNKELQMMLKPFQGELEIYPVPHEVGKVGNNSPNFILPIDSKENKNNIKNFFANAATKKKEKQESEEKEETDVSVISALRDNEPKAEATTGVKREHSASNIEDSLKRMKKDDEKQDSSPRKQDLKQTHLKLPSKSPTKKGGTGAKGNAAKDMPKITQFFGAKTS